MSVDEYINTISRMEPNITMVDRDAALASIAISLKRIADSVEATQDKLGEICSVLWHINHHS